MVETKGKEKTNPHHPPNNPEPAKNRVQKTDEDKPPGEAQHHDTSKEETEETSVKKEKTQEKQAYPYTQ